MLRKVLLVLFAGITMAVPAIAADTVDSASVAKVKQEIVAKMTSTVEDTKKTPASTPSTSPVPNPTTVPVPTGGENTIKAPTKVSQEKKIMINLASRFLTLYEGKTKIRMYPVGVGKVSTPTPMGYYKVKEKAVNPVWIDPDDTNVRIESGDDNPLGYRWLGFYGAYGIHGTNKPYSIGGYVSNGCIRMHEEDVEDLFGLISVGTPIEIYYDRIVIDRDADHTISYYIYPDGYGWQPLTPELVNKALSGYGVENFESVDDIVTKIQASDGEPTYIAKAYTLKVNNVQLTMRALGKDGIIYLPAYAVAGAANLDLRWKEDTAVAVTTYGQAKGLVKRDVVYINAADAPTIFHLKGNLNDQFTYELTNC